VLIAPQLDASPFYNHYHFDEPWDGPNNRLLGTRFGNYAVYRCPSDPHVHTANGSQMTSYLAVIGPESAWNGGKSLNNDEVTDPASDTIMIVEVENSGIHLDGAARSANNGNGADSKCARR
jgi:hypothetical protein